jgi:hypothetical protein
MEAKKRRTTPLCRVAEKSGFARPLIGHRAISREQGAARERIHAWGRGKARFI